MTRQPIVPAVISISALYVSCPVCKEAIPEPKTGSEMWTPEDVPQTRMVECDCGAHVRLRKGLGYAN